MHRGETVTPPTIVFPKVHPGPAKGSRPFEGTVGNVKIGGPAASEKAGRY